MSHDMIGECLRAYARLRQQIAAASWREVIARELEQLACDCKHVADISESFTRRPAIIPKIDQQDGITVCATS